MKSIVAARLAFLVAGGTAAGKTTDGALGQLVKQITQHNNNTTNYYVMDAEEAPAGRRSSKEKESLQYKKR